MHHDDMNTAKLAVDPLWQCLCPLWAPQSLARASRFLNGTRRPSRQCAKFSTSAPKPDTTTISVPGNGAGAHTPSQSSIPKPSKSKEPASASAILRVVDHEETSFLYGRLRAAAAHGKTQECRQLAEYLVKERKEKPNIQIYNALIASNVHHWEGAAWRVAEYLEEMKAEGLQPDEGVCHAVLKVLSVHVDHLLRSDTLEYMRKRWFQLSEDGTQDVIAGLLREGLFEQALERLETMRQDQMKIEPWLYDMAIYVLCDAGEIEEAYRIMRMRYDSGEWNLRRSVWAYLLDKGSEYRHHAATSLVWTSQVNQGYLNPSSGSCVNVLATASEAGDATLATEVFTHLSKRGTAFQPLHYELLISAYLSADPPDVDRAISILTIMPLEKLEPTVAETRSLYLYLRDNPVQLKSAFTKLRKLHQQGRKISIAILNLLIECYVEQKDLTEAMKIYKLIHTFAPIGKGAQKSFANIETFNLLLRGSRLANPPDEQQASFLVSELLALKVIPTAMTYDRLILVFVEAAKHALRSAATISGDPTRQPDAEKEKAKGVELLDWSFRHFIDMRPLGWMPRFGTLESLAIELAKVGDDRCWDVLQVAEDEGNKVEGFEHKGKWAKKNVEQAWDRFIQEKELKEGDVTEALESGSVAVAAA